MFLRRLLIFMAISVGALLFLVLGVVGYAAYDARMGASAAELTNVEFAAEDGTSLGAYLVEPTGEGPHPAVLLIHEWWGLNEDILHLADELAESGYVVLAVDAYRGRLAQSVPGALMLISTTSQSQIAADIDAAFDYLANLPQVDAERIGSVGFCFGGTQSMRLGTRQPNLAATVTFYGSGPITNPDELGVMGSNGPVLGIFGAEDQSIPLDEVEGFERALNERDVSNTITVYPDVGHAFVSSDTIEQSGQAQAAWTQLLNFLDDTLRTSTP